MKKIKVLHLTTDSKIGGAEKMLILLAENYDREKFEMIVVTLIGGGPLLSELSKRGCKAYSLNMRSKFDVSKFFVLYKILKLEKPDILNTYLFHADQLGRIIGKLARIKTIISSYRSPDYWKKKPHILIDALTAKLVDFFTANSELAKQTVIEREKIPTGKIKVINNGIKLSGVEKYIKFEHIDNLKKIHSIPDSKIIIGIVSNLTPVKNYEFFIDICSELNKKYDDLFFVSIGEGEAKEAQKIKQYAVEKKIDNLKFLGFQATAAELTAMFDIFALTSRWESSSRAILEAMAAGIPVVCGAVGGLNELVVNNKTGFLCKYSLEDFIDKISLLIENKELRRELGVTALQRATTDFSINNFLTATENLYSEIYNNRRKKIKILEIVTRLNIGGPAVNVIYITAFLDKNYFDVKLITGKESENEGNMFYLCQQKKVDYFLIPELGRELKPFKDLIAFIKIVCYIIKFRPDVVHTHTAKAGTLGRAAAIITFRKMIVHTFHGNIFDGYFSLLKTKFFLGVERMLAVFTDKIISVSNTQRADYAALKLGDYDKIINIPLGLELDVFKKTAEKKEYFRKQFMFSDDTVIISIVARLVPIKNHKLLIDAANILKNSFSNFKILIIGGGELEKELKDYIKKLNIEKYFEFIGFINDALPDYYAATDICALTSINEGLPTVIIEALAAKNAVVATNVGGVADLIKNDETGLLSEPGNPQMLAENLLKLCNNKELRNQLGSNGQKFVLQNYSVEKLIENFEKLYLKV